MEPNAPDIAPPAGGTEEAPHPEWTFEAAVDRLNEIADRLDGESLELDESLALFEEGVRLLRFADGVLQGADERIRQLVEDAGGALRLEPFDESP